MELMFCLALFLLCFHVRKVSISYLHSLLHAFFRSESAEHESPHGRLEVGFQTYTGIKYEK